MKAPAYVVFGGPTINQSDLLTLSTLNGSNGFKINGITSSGRVGKELEGVGDINNDGYEDFLLGAPNLPGFSSGEAFIIFGGPNVGSTGSIDLTTLNGSNGFRVFESPPTGDTFADEVTGLRDVNDDGIDDFFHCLSTKQRF